MRGLFYTGQSVTRIPERAVEELGSVQEIVTRIEEVLGAILPAASLPGAAPASP